MKINIKQITLEFWLIIDYDIFLIFFQLIAISISEGRIDYDNLIKCVTLYAQLRRTVKSFEKYSLFILGKWPRPKKGTTLNNVYYTLHMKRYNLMYFVEDIDVQRPVSRCKTMWSKLNLKSASESNKPAVISTMEKLLPKFRKVPFSNEFTVDDFSGVHYFDFSPLLYDIKSLENEFHILIKHVLQNIDNQFYIKSTVQMNTFLKIFLPDVFHLSDEKQPYLLPGCTTDCDFLGNIRMLIASTKFEYFHDRKLIRFHKQSDGNNKLEYSRRITLYRNENQMIDILICTNM